MQGSDDKVLKKVKTCPSLIKIETNREGRHRTGDHSGRVPHNWEA